MIEVELICNEVEEGASRLIINIDKVKGEENKSLKMSEISFANLSVKSYE